MPAPLTALVSIQNREFKMLREMIHRAAGIYLQDGKQGMLASRLAKRLRHHGLKDFAAYVALLQKVDDGGEELGEMINCITTNKTAFFREKHHFDFLAQRLIPELVAGTALGRKRSLRVWSAACSTGEEPYSIAISLLDALGAAYPASSGITGPAGGWEVEVIASDIDTRVLAKAAEGIYEGDAVNGMPPQQKAKYFLRGKDDRAGQVRVKKEVSDLVKFVRINLMDSSWALDGKFDVIFFRNALIYFTRETQEIFLRKMLTHLKPAGYLILGHSEHVPWLSDSVDMLGDTVHQLLSQRRATYAGPDRRNRPRV